MAGMLERGMEAEADCNARKRSLVVTALCVGGMVLARTVDHPAFADEVRRAKWLWR